MAQFESKKQIAFLFIGALVLSVVTITFINAEAQRRFGPTQREDKTIKGPSYLSRLKERIRSQLLAWLQKDEIPNSMQTRKLLSVDQEPYLEPSVNVFPKKEDSDRLLKLNHLQSQVLKRLGGNEKLLFDVLEAFCNCNEVKKIPKTQDQKKKPDLEVWTQDTNNKELKSNSTWNIFQKALTDLDYSEKIIRSYDFCATQGLIYVVMAILLTSLLNYTLILCCYFWCLGRRGSRLGLYSFNRKYFIRGKKDKMDYMDHEFTETDNFLPPLEEKGEKTP